MKIAKTVTDLIGRTPMVWINCLAKDADAKIAAKLESFNPLSSVKDRLALAMIDDAEKKGLIKKGSLIVEPTSGNTGIGLAYICAVRGYKLILTMPETMSVERKRIFKIFGAEIELTPGPDGMRGSIIKAEEIVKERKAFMPQQFNNPVNPEIHRTTTFREIWEDSENKIDIFIAGVGTGGTLTGIGEELKKNKKGAMVIAVEPADSPVLSEGKAGPNRIQGIGAGFVPEVLNTKIYDEVIKVKTEDAYKMTKRLALEEGIFAGISSGAAMHAAVAVAKRPENKDKLIVVLLPDTGERYLSMDFWEN